MAEVEEVEQQEESQIAEVMGMTPRVDEEETVAETSLKNPPAELAALEADDGPEAAAEEAEEKPAKSSLDIISERLSPPKAQDRNLEREIEELKARIASTETGYMSKLDQLIEGKKEKEPAPRSAVDEYTTPAIAKMLREAADDPEEQLRLLNTLSDEIATRKIEARMKPLEDRLNERETRDQQQSDVNKRMQEAAQAIEILAHRGGTEAALVADFKKNGQNSYLMRDWLSIPGVTLSHQQMVKNAVGLARMIDEAATNGNAPAASPARTEEPRPATSDTATAKPRASRRGAELTQPQPKQDPRENVLANLRTAVRSGGGLNDW